MSSDTDSEAGQEAQHDEDWEDWSGSDAQEDATHSLFSNVVLPNPEAAMAHDAANFGFDLRQYKAERHLDDYDVIRVVNFIRRQVAEGKDPLPVLAARHATAPWAGDEFLTPVLPDDPLITYDYEQEGVGGFSSDQLSAQGDGAAAGPGPSSQARVAALQAENEALRAMLSTLMLDSMPQELMEEVDAGRPGASTSAAAGAVAQGDTSAGPSTSASQAQQLQPGTSAAGAMLRRARPQSSSIDTAYFDSYSTFHIHREMLGDKARTEAYRLALEGNPQLLSGARVLDVGCGTGILSLFAARAGAARVTGVDGSTPIAGLAQKVAELNGLSESAGGPVRIISGRVEEVQDIGMQQVDVIVSEWMGYALLFESMLDSVLHARDRWLRPGGAVLPDIATIHVAGVSEAALGLDFWDDVYGFNMSPLHSEEASSMASAPLVREVAPQHIITHTAQLVSFDLTTMSPDQQDFTAAFTLEPLAAGNAASCSNNSSSSSKQGDHAAAGAGDVETSGSTAAGAASSAQSSEPKPVRLAAIALWFDTAFSERFCTQQPVVLSTAPNAPTTHWLQTLLPLREPIELAAAHVSASDAAGGSGASPANGSVGQPVAAAGTGSAATAAVGSGSGAVRIAGRLSMARSTHKHRQLDISLEVSTLDRNGVVLQAQAALFPMGVTDPAA